MKFERSDVGNYSEGEESQASILLLVQRIQASDDLKLATLPGFQSQYFSKGLIIPSNGRVSMGSSRLEFPILIGDE